MDFFIANKIAFQLVHLTGVLIALSGAALSDAAFFDFARDSRVTGEEVRRLRQRSRIVVVGLSIIIASGICLFFSDVDTYSHSPKFQAKMTIVLILLINGVVLHKRLLRALVRTVGVDVNTLLKWPRLRIELLVSGVTSSASWVSALILGTISSSPFDYATIMSFYLTFVTITLIGAMILRKRLI